VRWQKITLLVFSGRQFALAKTKCVICASAISMAYNGLAMVSGAFLEEMFHEAG